MAVIHVRRRAEEAFLAQFALIAALGQIGMSLARGLPLAARQRNPTTAHLETSCLMRLFVRRQDTARNLILLDRFEQRAEIALAETLIALALNDLKEDRSNHGLGKELQQQPAARRAIQQNAVCLHAGNVLAV